MTTPAAAQWAREAVSRFADDVMADPTLTPEECAALLARAEIEVRTRTEQTFLEVWSRLRLETALGWASLTVH